jgi:hypothetical protein
MIANIKCAFLVYLGKVSTTSVDEDGNPKYSDIDSENYLSHLSHGRICDMSDHPFSIDIPIRQIVLSEQMSFL